MKKLFSLLFVLGLALGFSACGSDSTSNTTTVDEPRYSIQGTITVGGTGLAHVSVELSGTSGTLARNSAITDADGKYTFLNCINGYYIITPLPSGYSFDKNSISVTVSSVNVTGQDFIATKKTSASAYLHYTFPDQTDFLTNYPGKMVDDEAAILFSGYTLTTGITYNTSGGTVSGYKVDQFVDQNTVNSVTPDPDAVLLTNDARKLYSYVVVSNNDQFDNRSKFKGSAPFYAGDLRWDQFNQFYLLDLNYSGKIHSPLTQSAGGSLKNLYNNKYAYDIIMFRKIDVKRPDASGTIATFEVGATTTSYVNDAEYNAYTGLTSTKFTVSTISFTDGATTYTSVKAISLDQFITDYVTDVPGSYEYKIVAVDDTFTATNWAWTDMPNAYYLPDYDFVCQIDSTPDPDTMVSGTKINFPARIELIGTAYEYSYSGKNPPAFAVYE
ncbi:MAG: carboxypeptidase-like regulatory domain-containing protein [Spirochaetota bacterium]